MRNPARNKRPCYVSYSEFSKFLTSEMSAKTIYPAVVRKVIWWADEIRMGDDCGGIFDIVYNEDGEPRISTSKRNVALFKSVYKDWKSKEKARQNKEIPHAKERSSADITARFMEEDREISTYVVREADLER